MCSKTIEISFLKSVGLGLVTIVMVSLQIRLVWIYYLYPLVSHLHKEGRVRT
jgi:hypothetical protein